MPSIRDTLVEEAGWDTPNRAGRNSIKMVSEHTRAPHSLPLFVDEISDLLCKLVRISG